MNRKTMLSVIGLAGMLLLSGCTSRSDQGSSEPPTLGPPQRAEFRNELPDTASYRKLIRRFDGTHFLYKNAETYDDHGNIVRIAEVDINTGAETVTRTYSYTYNEDGSAAEVCDYSYVSTRTVYTYNENGDTVKTEVYDVDTGALKSTVTNEYNEQGDLVKSVQTDAGGKEALLSYSKYEYGENGKASVKYEYYSDDSLKSTDTYTYDSNGLLMTDERIIENSPVPKEIFTYEYDAAGNQTLKAETDYSEDGSVKTESQIKTTYDQSSRMIKRENILNGSVNWYELYDYEELAEPVTIQ